MPHGFINLEYLLIGAAGVFLSRGTVFLLLCLGSIADATYTVCYTYQFSLEDLLSSIRYLPLLPRERVLEGAAFFLLVLLVCAVLSLVLPRPKNRLKTSGAMLLLFALLLPIDILSGQNPLAGRDTVLLPFRVARSPMMTLLWREGNDLRILGMERKAGDAPLRSASSGAVSLLLNHTNATDNPNVVMIVVESWGQLLNPQLAQALATPYNDPRIARKYNVSYGTVPFTGLTVPGEARELCHSTVGFGIIHISSEHSEECLPAFFHERGYRNLAIHGYTSEMFYRYTWYRTLGFDKTYFEPALENAGLPICRGAFPGICDASIAHWIGRSLLTQDQKKPEFIYWVTLNSHIPVPNSPDLPKDGVCSTLPALQSSVALCSWFRLVRSVHQSVQDVALGSTARPTVFILVGDHAPPFSDAQLRGEFSRTEVPYVMLTPTALSSR
jgi:hypothetical protein